MTWRSASTVIFVIIDCVIVVMSLAIERLIEYRCTWVFGWHWCLKYAVQSVNGHACNEWTTVTLVLIDVVSIRPLVNHVVGTDASHNALWCQFDSMYSQQCNAPDCSCISWFTTTSIEHGVANSVHNFEHNILHIETGIWPSQFACWSKYFQCWR